MCFVINKFINKIDLKLDFPTLQTKKTLLSYNFFLPFVYFFIFQKKCNVYEY